jgi:hypothetical protein
VLWAGSIQFKEAPKPDRYRVVVTEIENIPVDATGFFAVAQPSGTRVVYAATISYNYP